MYRQNFI